MEIKELPAFDEDRTTTAPRLSGFSAQGSQATYIPQSRYRCLLCESSIVYWTFDSFKRHIEDKHHPRSYFRCFYPSCPWTSPRPENVTEHYRTRHNWQIWLSDEELTQYEILREPPKRCEGCNYPYDSWDDYFSCMAIHCRLPERAAQSLRENAWGFISDPYDGGDDSYSDAPATDYTVARSELPQVEPNREDSLMGSSSTNMSSLTLSSTILQVGNGHPGNLYVPSLFQKDDRFSDSAYHSGLGTDTESVYSMGSIGSSLGLPKDFLQDFISFFANTLFDRVGARVWAEYALEQHPPAFIEQHLNRALRDYAIEISSVLKGESMEASARVRLSINESQIARQAIKLIRRYRHDISRYFCCNAMSMPAATNSMATLLEQLGKQLSLADKLNLFDKHTSARKDADEHLEDALSDDGIENDLEEDKCLAQLGSIHDFLILTEPFHHLLIAMRQILYCDDRTKMSEIRNLMLEELLQAELDGYSNLPSHRDNTNYSGKVSHTENNDGKDNKPFYSISFQIEWDLLGFLSSRFGDREPRLGSLIVLTGTALYAQATTCVDYLQRTWPHSGAFFLSTLQDVLKSSTVTSSQGKIHHATAFHPDLELRIRLFSTDLDGYAPTSRVSIAARGTAHMLIDLAQQIAWIGSALSISPFDEKIAYSEAKIAKTASERPEFHVIFVFKPLDSAESPCWLPLFRSATIARAFPIAERHNEIGLEIPVEIMAAIAGVRHAVEFEGGVVMKGFSSMFVPMTRNGDRVQWHLICSPDCETRLSYREVLDGCPNRATLNEVSLESLRTTRAIVGWCSEATCILGSEAANYENIDYSGAEDVGRELKLAGGTFGIQQFAIAQLDITLGPKDGICYFPRSGPYRSIISAAEKTPIVLYDTGEKRGWLVPATSVMLHIAHHRNRLEPFEVNGKQVKLCAVSPTGPSAEEVLLQSSSISLSDCESYTFRDMISNIWSIIEFLREQQLARDQSSGSTLKGLVQTVVHGFEFKAITDQISPFRLKLATIRNTSGGWPVLQRDIDALVLFANGYEDVIQPLMDQNKGLRHKWGSVPKGKDYLATSVKTLKRLYDVAGCRLTRKYLTTTHLRLYRGNSLLFEPCKTPGAYICDCTRLQRICKELPIGDVPPEHLVDDGAVIIGQSRSTIQDFMTAPQPQLEQNGLFSQPNVPLMPSDSHGDSDNVPSSPDSDGESSLQSSSEGTSRTSISSATSYTSQESVGTSMPTDPSDLSGNVPYRKRRCSFDNKKPRRWKMPRLTMSSFLSSRNTQEDKDSEEEDGDEYGCDSVRQRHVAQAA